MPNPALTAASRTVWTHIFWAVLSGLLRNYEVDLWMEAELMNGSNSILERLADPIRVFKESVGEYRVSFKLIGNVAARVHSLGAFTVSWGRGYKVELEPYTLRSDFQLCNFGLV